MLPSCHSDRDWPIETCLTSFGVGPAHEIQLNSKQSFWIRKQNFRIRKQSFLIRKQNFWIRKQNFWICKQNFWVCKQNFWIPINIFFITLIYLAIKHFLIAVSIVLLSNQFFDCSVESFALKPIIFDCIIKTQIYLHRGVALSSLQPRYHTPCTVKNDLINKL